jgi:hypothetical protein
MVLGAAEVVMGEAYCEEGCSRGGGGGPPSIEDIDMLLPLLCGRPNADSDGRSRFVGKPVGGPTDTGGGLGGGGP